MFSSAFSFLLSAFTLIRCGESFVAPAPFLFKKTRTILHPGSTLFDAKGELLDEVKTKVESTFGSVVKEATKKINQLTGNDEYDFEDLVKLLDQKARAAVSDLTQKEESDFEDLIELAETKIKGIKVELETKEEWAQLKEISMAAGYEVQKRLEGLMGSETADLEEVQEVATREIVSLLKSREYNIGDLFFLLKLCTAFGLGMNPSVMSIFPLNVLIQLYNFSLIQEAGNGVATSLALEMDRRARNSMVLEMDKQAKIALFGDADAEVGALFKEAVLDSIGKSDYNFGDITQNLLEAIDSSDKDIEPIGVADKANNVVELNPELEKDLQALDKALDDTQYLLQTLDSSTDKDAGSNLEP